MLQTISRRDVVKGVAAGLPLAAILADPLLARAAANSLQDVTITTDGGRKVNAALALPHHPPAPTVLLVHEWWGLNDQIKTMAADLAKQGYLALAVDLYNGHVTDKPDEARKLVDAAWEQNARRQAEEEIESALESYDTILQWLQALTDSLASTSGSAPSK